MAAYLGKWLSPEWEKPAAPLSERFAAAPHFPHLVLDNFLHPERCEALLREFPAFDAAFARDDNGGIGLKCVRSNLPELGAAYAGLDELLSSAEFLGWVEASTGLKGLRGDKTYLGGGTHESLPGEDLDFHIDFNVNYTNWLRRKLNVLLYLNQDWRAEWGGSLLLHADPKATTADASVIAPVFNRLVIMESSSRSWHGFSKVACPPGFSRKSIACYFYSEEAEKVDALPRETIYRDRPIHEDCSGEELAVLLERRISHLRRLERGELEFIKRIQAEAQVLNGFHPKLARTVRSGASGDRAELLWQVYVLDASIREMYKRNSHFHEIWNSIHNRAQGMRTMFAHEDAPDQAGKWPVGESWES